MKTLTCYKTGKTVILERELDRGGAEGAVWYTDQRGKLAKIFKGTLFYKELYPELDEQERQNKTEEQLKNKEQELKDKIEKLKVMVDYLPTDPDRSKNHISFVWPESLLKYEDQIVGFLMPEVKDAKGIFNAYNRNGREENFPHFHYDNLHEIAFNLAKVFQEVHEHDIVIGDVNQKNFLVTNNAEVTLIDIDSVQVYDRKGKCYKCTVGTPEYDPPELKSYKEERKPEHDLHGLGVLIYQLLIEGRPPFPPQGKKQPSYVYKHPPDASGFDTLHSKVSELMQRFLYRGCKNPQERPSAKDWVVALQEAKQSLKRCSNNERHYYQQHLQNCLWCERAYKKFDAFPPISGYKLYDPTKTSPYDDQREYEKTLADDNQAIQLNPQLAKAYNNRGIVYYEQGKYEKALAEYNQAIQLNPKYFEAYCNRGVIYYEQGKYEEALADCNEAIQLNPKDAGVYYNRGLTYKANRNIEKAISDFEKAAELYKQQANQEWYQNSLDQLKGLSKPKPSSTFYKYPSTSKKRRPKTSIKSSSSPLLSFFVGISGFVFAWSLRFLVLVSSFIGIIVMLISMHSGDSLVDSLLALHFFLGIAFFFSVLLGRFFDGWMFCRALSMCMLLSWTMLFGLGGLIYMLIGIFAGSKLIASGFVYFCFGCASMMLAGFLIDRWGWTN